MSLHKLSAGDGYQYLVRQTAAADQDLTGRQSLSDYYTEKGERPGRWLGRGLGDLEGVNGGATVDGEQMRALFGEGRHPNAEALERAALRSAAAAGLGASAAARQASAASALGRKFTAPTREGALAIACARAYESYNVEHGRPRNAAVPEEARTEIRTAVARRLFEEKHGRPPAPGGRELSGFMARESRPAEQACAGYDLTFSPVKSVSTLWAIADRDTAAVIEAAHQAAVEDTIEWLEREVIYTRRGAGGVRTVDVEGVIAAAFLHRDARSGDPDLHTHVAIANKVRDPSDGAWLAIDGQVLYKHTVAASERYNARLETELTARLGVRWAESSGSRRDAKRAVREIVGVPRDLMQRWSQRRTAIDAQLAILTADFRTRHGRVPSAKEMLALAQEANLATREAKHEHRSEADQRAQWRREAAETLGAEESVDAVVSGLLEQGRSRRPEQVDALGEGQLRALAASVLSRVTEDRATFQRAHVTAEAARQVRALHVAPAALDRAVHAVVDVALSGEQVAVDEESGTAAHVESAVALGPAGDRSDSATRVPAAFARADGSSQYETPGAALFTTARVLSAEQTVVAAAAEQTDLQVPRSAVAVALMEEVANGGVDLNAGQRALVDDFVTGGQRVRLAIAPAGTGKTTAMRAAAAAWRHHGGRVLALAPSAAAAGVLGESIGARADTLAKLRFEILNGASPDGPLREVQHGTMIVIDEAGMACARDLAIVVEAARRRGAVVRLIGDDQQLAAVGAGGVLRDVEAAAGANRALSEVVRFRTPGEAEASLAMREGRAEEALGWLLDHGRVRTTSTPTATGDVFSAWRDDVDQGLDALMIAASNDDVTALNRLARLHRLSGPENTPSKNSAAPPAVELASGLEASAGDTIITRRNERTLSVTATDFVKNGDRWTVQRVLRDGGLRARHHSTGRTITLPAAYVARDVDLGYATTVYGAQGQTVDTTHALIDGREDRQTAYVALTRGRACNTAHVVASGDGDAHNLLRPENLQQRSAAETLHAVLSRDGSATSATSTHHEETSAATQLATAVAVHVDATARAAELQLGRAALEHLVEQANRAYAEASGVSPQVAAAGTAGASDRAGDGSLSDSRSWQHLQSWLALRDLEDGPGAGLQRLRAALVDAPTELGGRPVEDPAALLLSRLQRTIPAGGPLAWLPPVSSALRARLDENDPATWAWLDERGADVRDRAADVAREATGWTHATAPAWAQPYLAHAASDRTAEDPARDLVADLAVWRAAHRVPDEDLRPAGPRPSDRAERTHFTRLITRATRLQPRTGGRSADAWAHRLARLADAGVLPALSAGVADSAALDTLVTDTWWPVLAARLEDLVGDVDTWAGAALRDAAATLPATIEAADNSHDAPAPPLAPTGDSAESPVDHDPASGPHGDEDAMPPWAPQRPAARTVEAHRAAAALYRSHLAGSWVPAYLAERGMGHLVDDGTAGYAPRSGTALVDHLAGRGFSSQEILEAGLAVERSTGTLVDRFRDRLMFTIADRAVDPAAGATPAADAEHPVAVPIAFIGRAATTAGPRVPRYLNTSATAAYSKGSVLYGLAEHADALAAGAVPVLVEGPMDAEAVTRAGRAAASRAGGEVPLCVGLATCGTALKAEHVAALGAVVDLEHRTVLVATDDDAAGQKAADRAWRLLRDGGCADSRTVDLGEHNDPADVVQHQGADALAASVASSATAQGLDAAARSLHAKVIASRLREWEPVLDHIDGRLGAVRALAGDIAAGTPDQQAYATAQLLVHVDLDADTIHAELDGDTDPLAIPTAQVPTQAAAELDDVDQVDQVHHVVEDAGEPDPVFLVDQLLVDALAERPLPDEHAAAALWARLADALGEARRSAAAADRMLAGRVGPDRAARVAATPAWPALRDLARAEPDAVEAALAAVPDHLLDEDTAAAYAAAVLAHAAPAGAPPRPARRPSATPEPPQPVVDERAREATRSDRSDLRQSDDERRPRDPGRGPRL